MRKTGGQSQQSMIKELKSEPDEGNAGRGYSIIVNQDIYINDII